MNSSWKAFSFMQLAFGIGNHKLPPVLLTANSQLPNAALTNKTAGFRQQHHQAARTVPQFIWR
jgi:hypothetical protein